MHVHSVNDHVTVTGVSITSNIFLFVLGTFKILSAIDLETFHLIFVNYSHCTTVWNSRSCSS